MLLPHAEDCIARCRALALHTQEPGFTTRTFLSPPMHKVHRDLTEWMSNCGMEVRVDGVGNLCGRYPAGDAGAAVLCIGSHLDTVPRAGAFDGILGVVMGVMLIELLQGRRLPFAIEVVGFSEEEGVRFGFPFLGSRAFIGELDRALLLTRDRDGVSAADAIRAFGLDGAMQHAEHAQAYLEFHIEQGPVLESLGLPVGAVVAIAGQTRMQLTFEGRAGHAGTTPMALRRDALACAAEWIGDVERYAAANIGMVATVGRMEVLPGAPNVIPGKAILTLDIRHEEDSIREHGVEHLLTRAYQIARPRGIHVTSEMVSSQASVPMDSGLTQMLAEAAGHTVHRMVSGAGHDAMIMARKMPAAMLFLRSPGGLSHHPGESVLAEDVAAALAVGLKFLDRYA